MNKSMIFLLLGTFTILAPSLVVAKSTHPTSAPTTLSANKPPTTKPHNLAKVHMWTTAAQKKKRQASLSLALSKSIHPLFYLRGADGKILKQGQGKASSEKTCGTCHDTGYIISRNTHTSGKVYISCFRCHELQNLKASDFNQHGQLKKAPKPPSSETCGKCHGFVHGDKSYMEYSSEVNKGKDVGSYSRTLHNGVIFSPQLISFSLLNIKNKEKMNRPWDVHAERGLHCTSCHFPANHPGRADQVPRKGPKHLIQDPRTIQLSMYLKRPDHRLATAACSSCHNTDKAHEKLTYVKKHMASLSCQACHVPKVYGPALRSVDRTVVTPQGGPKMHFRGIDKRNQKSPNVWFYKGFRPTLLYEKGKFTPYNLVTVWRWVSGKKNNPVKPALVKKAWQNEKGKYHPELIALFDQNKDKKLVASELLLDSPKKTKTIVARLKKLGVSSPRIYAELKAYPVRHGVVSGKWVEHDCATCHAKNSRFNVPLTLTSGSLPGGVSPIIPSALMKLLGKRVTKHVKNKWILTGSVEPQGHYVFGHNRHNWSDLLGFWLFLLTLLGVAGHASLRRRARKKGYTEHHEEGNSAVYIYGAYERIWHWTMVISIFVLILTGLEVHYPENFHFLDYSLTIFIHNSFAILLMFNSFLGVFYHLTTGEIKQFIPKGSGLPQRVWIQTKFYTRGIFVGVAHPFTKTRQQKLNPLQQLTYIGLLNVLLPFQIITGIAMWFIGEAPNASGWLGDLSWLGPLHNMGSWLFISFVFLHIYLTTIGPTMFGNIKAMITGWDYEAGSQEETTEPTGDKT